MSQKKNGRPLSRIAKALHEQIPNEQERSIYREVAVRGRATKELASQLKLSEARIQGIIRRVRRWLEQVHLPIDVRSLQSMHLARLEHQWHEAMSAWYRSGNKDETIKSSYEDQKREVKDGKRKVERTTRQPCGDVRYLEQARKIMAEYRKLSDELAADINKEQRDAQSHPLADQDEKAARAIAELREQIRKEQDS